MFDSIILRPNQSRQHPVDFGQLTENLLFYGQSTLHISRPEIISLIQNANLDTIINLFSRPELNVLYNNSHSAVAFQDNQDGHTYYDLNIFSLANFDIEEQFYKIHLELTGDTSRSKWFSKKISSLVNEYKLPEKFSQTFNEEVKDETFRMKVLFEALNYHYPEHGLSKNQIRFDVNYVSSDIFYVDSNIDFNTYSKLSVNSILLYLINTVEDVQVIAEANSDISLPEINSLMVRLKINDLVEKSEKSTKEIEVFNHYIYDDSILLRETINSGSKSLEDFFPILDKAAKYKHWLHDLPNDKNLLKEYIKKVGEKTWLEQVQSKAVRFYLVAGINTLLNITIPQPGGIIASTGLSAFNTFVLEKLIKKWKPNQFIENELLPLVK